jgi:hypothetical protein
LNQNQQLSQAPAYFQKEVTVALYKEFQYLKKSEDASFDAVHSPGGIPPHSGIYRCVGCGREVVAEAQRKLPPQNHHQHTPTQGAVRWKMIVYADHEAQ